MAECLWCLPAASFLIPPVEWSRERREALAAIMDGAGPQQKKPGGSGLLSGIADPHVAEHAKKAVACLRRTCALYP